MANPPFSNKNWTNGIVPTSDIYNRFEVGIPPEKNGDYAFLLHLIASLKTTGKGAIILPHGVLFRGDAEARIRTELLRQGIIKGIIGLPTNLFYGTGIPACIIVIDKQVTFNEKGQALSDKGVFMIDASKGFIKDGNKNRLREQDIHKIVDTFTTQKELEHYSRLVSLDEISRNDYNLNIPRYIDSADKADMQDLHAHLYGGGIPKSDIDDLGEFWSIFAQTKTKIFTSNGSLYSPNFVPSKLKATIQVSSEYVKFENEILLHFNNWHEENDLKSIKQKDHPKELIKTYGESLLKHFKETKLVSDYDIYQVFMDYVADTLSDDVYAIAQNGWLTARDLTPVEKGDKQTPNLILGSGKNAKKFISEIIPPELISKRYFAQDIDQISLLEAQISKKQDEFTNFVDEFGEDELSNAYDDKDKITLKSLKEAIRQTSDKNEQEIYNKALQILTEQKELESTLKAATGELNQKVFDKFKTLDENEIKTLVVNDKWLSELKEQILSTVERAVQECITRISTLAARYDKTLDELTERANALSLRVKAHLDAMDKAR